MQGIGVVESLMASLFRSSVVFCKPYFEGSSGERFGNRFSLIVLVANSFCLQNSRKVKIIFRKDEYIGAVPASFFYIHSVIK